MNFDESFFEEITSDKKDKIKQHPYSVRRQEFCWFLSDNSNADISRIIEQLKYKADYLYAQMEYVEALKCYKELLPLIPASNTVLRQEVCESRVMSLIKMDATEDAEKFLKEMIEDNKMNNSLWYLMFAIQKDKENLEEATFSIQQCLEENEEVASYWLDLAETYGLYSKCFDWSSEPCSYQSDLAGDIESTETAKARCSSEVEQYTCIRSLQDKDSVKQLLMSKHTNNETKNARPNTEMTSTCSIKESNDSELDTTESKKGFNVGHDYEELTSYTRNHHYCYCALCSLLISRFLLRKYPSPSLLTKDQRKRDDENVKVNSMVKSITCATDELINATRKLLYEKFSVRMKTSHSADGTYNMGKTVQDFERRWFTIK